MRREDGQVMAHQDLETGGGGGQQALERTGLALVDDHGGGGQQAGDGELDHHGRGGLRHGQDVLVLRFGGDAGSDGYPDGRVLPGGQGLRQGRIEGGRIVRHFCGDAGGADRAGQAVGGHQQFGFDRGGGGLGWVGIKAQFQRAAVADGLAVTGWDNHCGSQFTAADQGGEVGFGAAGGGV